MTPLASLRLSLAVLLASLAASDRMLARLAPAHFIPERRMRDAVAAGPGCVVLAGDSRMVAGGDLEELGRALRDAGRPECVTSIAIGALPIHGIDVALREYVRRGGKPRTVVLGSSEDLLLPPRTPPDPASFAGNDAISLTWSEASDVRRLYPRFPGGNVREFDDAVRFLLARETGFGSYGSLIWQKVQHVQDRLVGEAKVVTNVFGAAMDMQALAGQMQNRAHELLAETMSRPEDARLHPDFAAFEQRVHDVGADLVVVELPMPDVYRRTVTDSEAGRRYRAWFGARVAERGGRFVDLTHAPWLAPGMFGDALHLNAEGARHFSTDLGRALASPRPNDAPR